MAEGVPIKEAARWLGCSEMISKRRMPLSEDDLRHLPMGRESYRNKRGVNPDAGS